MSQVTSRRPRYGSFRLPFIIEIINFEQRYLVKFSPGKFQNLIEPFSQCIFCEYEEKTVSNFTFQVTFKMGQLFAMLGLFKVTHLYSSSADFVASCSWSMPRNDGTLSEITIKQYYWQKILIKHIEFPPFNWLTYYCKTFTKPYIAYRSP